MTQTEMKDAIAQILPEVTALRHELHRFPEIRFQEEWTSERIAYELGQSGIAVERGYGGGTGLVADIKGKSDRIIALRADMDGLEILEETGLAYASEIPRCMHACGHDGHIAMLCGAAKILAQHAADMDCTARLIFQPGEELGMGGRIMVEEGVLDGVETVFGMHGWPSIPLGKVGLKMGIAMAGADWFHITIKGQGCHGANPASGVDPIRVAAHIVVALLNIVDRELEQNEPAVVSVGSIHGGTTNNTIPEIVEIAGSARTLSAPAREKVCAAINRIVIETAEAFYATATVTSDENAYVPLYNDPVAAAFARQAIDDGLGAGKMLDIETPSLASEDFAFYLQQVPGALLWLGTQSSAGKMRSLHSPHFDFNDDALAIGISVWLSLVMRFSREKSV